MEEITNIAQLREKIHQLHFSFLLKVHLALQYSSNHPDEINEIGIYWIDKNGVMCTNSQVLGNFIGLKPNSINKNFALYGINQIRFMKIRDQNYHQLIEQGKWVYRQSVKFSFTPQTPTSEIKSIRMYSSQPNQEKRKPETKLVNEIQIISLDNISKRNESWKTSIGEKFRKFLKNFPIDSKKIKLIDIHDFYINLNIETRSLIKLQILLSFFAHDEELIDVDNFFLFSCFFGIGKASIELINKFPLFIEEYSSEPDNGWLNLVNASPSLIALFRKQPAWTWCLALSDEPGMFLLLINVEGYTTQTEIYFDTLQSIYFILTSQGGIETFHSLDEIVFDHVGLNRECIINLNPNIPKIDVPIDMIDHNLQFLFWD